MATIALYKDKINRVGFQLEGVINSSDKLSSQLNVLKNVLQGVDSSTCDLQDAVDSITSSTKSESDIVEDVRRLNAKLSEFINMAVERDDSARSEIVREKNEFYEKYSYLKPDCEKKKKKKTLVQKIQDSLKKVCDWCKEHSHELKIVITIGIVVTALAVVICCPGASAIVAGACWGAISGACIGGVAGGINSQIHDGEFWDGFVNGACDGAIGGAIGGAISGGLVYELGQATTLARSIGQGASVGAISSGTSNMAVTTIDYLIEHDGELDGASDDILMAGFSGALSGGILGGVMGGLQFESPSNLAWGDQGDEVYTGRDSYVDINMHKGDVICRGEPGGKEFFTSLDAVESSGRDRTTLFKGLQVKAHKDYGYRHRVSVFRFTRTVTVGYGKALANPKYGDGGLEQFYVPNVKELIKKGILEYVDDIELEDL